MCSALVRRASAAAIAAAKAKSSATASIPNYYVRTLASSSSASSDYLVVNAVGKDRTGIVSEMTKIVTDAGGNVGDSQAARLGSHFSLMMHVSVPKESGADALREALDGMEGMSVSCFVDDDPREGEATPKIGYSGAFKLSGADNPGIVHQLTSVLARNGLSIDKMETSQEDAPFGGATLFVVTGIANAHKPLPDGFDPDSVRDELEGLGDELNCDVTLEDVSSASGSN